MYSINCVYYLKFFLNFHHNLIFWKLFFLKNFLLVKNDKLHYLANKM